MIVQKNLARCCASKISKKEGAMAGMYRRAMNPRPRVMSLLSGTRTCFRIALGSGNCHADAFFVGESPLLAPTMIPWLATKPAGRERRFATYALPRPNGSRATHVAVGTLRAYRGNDVTGKPAQTCKCYCLLFGHNFRGRRRNPYPMT